jgi:hypothetical protein
MKEKVWIFGDSFSDPKYINNNNFSWPTELAKNYDVNNLSLCGTGPDWSLDRLLQIQKLNQTQDINLIFFISNPHRFDFKFYKDARDQVLYFYLLNGPDNKDSDNRIAPYQQQKEFVKLFNRWYLGCQIDSYIDKEIMKYVGALKLLEKIFKKILVWPIFDMLKIQIDQGEKFYVVNDLPLANIESDLRYTFSNDSRANHLSDDNHLVMLEQLSNWIDYSKQIDITRFRINTPN